MNLRGVDSRCWFITLHIVLLNQARGGLVFIFDNKTHSSVRMCESVNNVLASWACVPWWKCSILYTAMLYCYVPIHCHSQSRLPQSDQLLTHNCFFLIWSFSKSRLHRIADDEKIVKHKTNCKGSSHLNVFLWAEGLIINQLIRINHLNQCRTTCKPFQCE